MTIHTDQGQMTPQEIVGNLTTKMAMRSALRRDARNLTEHPRHKLCPDQFCGGPLERIDDVPEPSSCMDGPEHHQRGWYCQACERAWKFGDVDAPQDRGDE